jgi:hypothetical protein
LAKWRKSHLGRKGAGARNLASRRAERVEVYRDRDTGLILQRWGADRGTPERARHQGGLQLARDKIYALLGPAYAALPGPIEMLLVGGALGETGDVLRRRLQAAADLREYATRAGVQRRWSGRYDVGARGRNDNAPESPRVTRARRVITLLAGRLSWPVLGTLLDLVLFELEVAPYPALPPPPPRKEDPPQRVDEDAVAYKRRLGRLAEAQESAAVAWRAQCARVQADLPRRQAEWRARFAGVPKALDLLADQLRLVPAMAP